MTDTTTPAVRWEDLTWPEIEELLRGRPHEVALLPVGATEQHGPHLPAGTDTIIAKALSEAVSARTGAIVLPPSPSGAASATARCSQGRCRIHPNGCRTWCATWWSGPPYQDCGVSLRSTGTSATRPPLPLPATTCDTNIPNCGSGSCTGGH